MSVCCNSRSRIQIFGIYFVSKWPRSEQKGHLLWRFWTHKMALGQNAYTCRTLFTQIVNNESHSLHYLLPVKRDSQLIGRLRSATAYPTFRVRTNRFKNSFLHFCLSNYQWHLWYFNLLCVFFLCLIVNLCVCLYPAYGCHKTINVCMYIRTLPSECPYGLWTDYEVFF